MVGTWRGPVDFQFPKGLCGHLGSGGQVVRRGRGMGKFLVAPAERSCVAICASDLPLSRDGFEMPTAHEARGLASKLSAWGYVTAITDISPPGGGPCCWRVSFRCESHASTNPSRARQLSHRVAGCGHRRRRSVSACTSPHLERRLARRSEASRSTTSTSVSADGLKDLQKPVGVQRIEEGGEILRCLV